MSINAEPPDASKGAGGPVTIQEGPQATVTFSAAGPFWP